jgi:hypothetical protein
MLFSCLARVFVVVFDTQVIATLCVPNVCKFIAQISGCVPIIKCQTVVECELELSTAMPLYQFQE